MKSEEKKKEGEKKLIAFLKERKMTVDEYKDIEKFCVKVAKAKRELKEYKLKKGLLNQIEEEDDLLP